MAVLRAHAWWTTPARIRLIVRHCLRSQLPIRSTNCPPASAAIISIFSSHFRITSDSGGASWCRMNDIKSKSSNGSNHMNVPHFVPSVSCRLLSMGSLILAASLNYASGEDLSKYKRIEPQFIAALGDPGATSGNGAQSWGLWSQDPGPRGCKLDRYDQLKARSE